MYYLCSENKVADLLRNLSCVFVFAYAKSMFSHDAAYLFQNNIKKLVIISFRCIIIISYLKLEKFLLFQKVLNLISDYLGRGRERERERELICLFYRAFVGSVRRDFLFLLVLRIGCGFDCSTPLAFDITISTTVFVSASSSRSVIYTR